jgi:hypothetical protein
MDKEISLGNAYVIALVLWVASFHDVTNIFEALITICVSFVAIIFGRMK